MKGISRAVVLALESWLCPWYFKSTYPRPSQYFIESEETVLDVDGATVYNRSSEFKKLSDSIAKTVTDTIKNVEDTVSNHNERIEELSNTLTT